MKMHHNVFLTVALCSLSIALHADPLKLTIGIGNDCGKNYCTDGIDDEIEINSAINALAPDGGLIELDNGTYYVSSNVVVKDNTTLRGQGFSSIIKLADGVNGLNAAGIIRVKKTSAEPGGARVKNVTLENFTIDGNKENQTWTVDNRRDGMYGVYSEADSLTLRNLYIHSAPGYGVDPHESVSVQIPTKNFVIENCRVEQNGLDGITLDAVQDSIVTNNIVINNERHGINVIKTSGNVVVSNNVVKDNGYTYSTLGHGVVSSTTYGLNLTDNIIDGNAKAGIQLIESERAMVSNNVISNNQRNGIEAQSLKASMISNNILSNNGQGADNTYTEISFDTYNSGELSYPSTNNHVVGNSIMADADSRSRYGITESDETQNYNIIVANIIAGVRQSPLVLYGPKSRNLGNTLGLLD